MVFYHGSSESLLFTGSKTTGATGEREGVKSSTWIWT